MGIYTHPNLCCSVLCCPTLSPSGQNMDTHVQMDSNISNGLASKLILSEGMQLKQFPRKYLNHCKMCTLIARLALLLFSSLVILYVIDSENIWIQEQNAYSCCFSRADIIPPLWMIGRIPIEV